MELLIEDPHKHKEKEREKETKKKKRKRDKEKSWNTFFSNFVKHFPRFTSRPYLNAHFNIENI